MTQFSVVGSQLPFSTSSRVETQASLGLLSWLQSFNYSPRSDDLGTIRQADYYVRGVTRKSGNHG